MNLEGYNFTFFAPGVSANVGGGNEVALPISSID